MKSVFFLILLALTATNVALANDKYSGSDMRLVGSTVGVLQVQTMPGAPFLPVCADGVSSTTLQAVCRGLGYTSWSQNSVYVDPVPSSDRATSGSMITGLDCPMGAQTTSLAECNFSTTTNIQMVCPINQLAVSCTGAGLLMRVDPSNYQLLVRSSAASKWSAVCDTEITGVNRSTSTAKQLCGMLARPNSDAAMFAVAPSLLAVESPTAIGNVRCSSSSSSGTQLKSLADCTYDSTPTCTASKSAVGLYCSAQTFPPPPSGVTLSPSANNAADFDIGVPIGDGWYLRLESGGDPSPTGAGRVLVRRTGEHWRTVSHSGIDDKTATSLCVMAGFMDAGTADTAGFSVAPTPGASSVVTRDKSGVAFSGLKCPSSATTSLSGCNFTVLLAGNTTTTMSTTHNNDLYLRCLPTPWSSSGSYYFRLLADGRLQQVYSSYYSYSAAPSFVCGGVTAQVATLLCKWMGFGDGASSHSVVVTSSSTTPRYYSGMKNIKCTTTNAASFSSCTKSTMSTTCGTLGDLKLQCVPSPGMVSGSWEFKFAGLTSTTTSLSYKTVLLRPVTSTAAKYFNPSDGYSGICHRGFTTRTADNLCKLLGFEAGGSYTYSSTNSPPIKISSVSCSTTATSFDQCAFTEVTSCYRNRYVMLACRHEQKTPTVKSGSYLMRLDQFSNAVELRAATSKSSAWPKYICDDGMGASYTQRITAGRLCHFAGFTGGTLMTVSSSKIPSSSRYKSNIIMRGLMCTASATSLDDCSKTLSNSGCTTSEIIGVTCTGSFSGEPVNESSLWGADGYGGGPGSPPPYSATGKIVGAVLGSVFAVVLVVSLIGWCRAMQRRKRESINLGGNDYSYLSSPTSSPSGADADAQLGTMLRRHTSARSVTSDSSNMAASAAAAASSPIIDGVDPNMAVTGQALPTAGFVAGFGMSSAATPSGVGAGDNVAPPPGGYNMSIFGGSGTTTGMTTFGGGGSDDAASGVGGTTIGGDYERHG